MRRREGGSSMIELMITVTAGIFIMSMFMTAIANLAALGRAKREGSHLAAGAEALASYLRTHGASIVASGTAPGFTDPYHPAFTDLRSRAFLPSFIAPVTPFGGALSFVVRKGPQNDLFGLVCDTQSITERGAPSPQLAGEVVMAANGAGLRTSIANQGTLNGPGFTGVASPINGPAIVCAWAYLARPA